MKAENLARMRELLDATRPSHPVPEEPASADTAEMLPALCPCCGCHLCIIEAFEAGYQLGDRASTTAADIRIETS